MADWYVTTDFFWRDGRKVAGPYGSQEEAMRRRSQLERIEGHSRYFVDEENEDNPAGGVS